MIACQENQPMSDPTPSPVSLSVWQIYKSRFIYTQAFIVVGCGAIYLYRRNVYFALAAFGCLQLAAIYGSLTGKRMLDDLNARNARLREAQDEQMRIVRDAQRPYPRLSEDSRSEQKR